MKYCWVIPHFNHAEEFVRFFPELVATGLPCIIVDDGSDAANLTVIDSLLASDDNTYLIMHSHNRGKGAAVITACYFARTMGFTHVIQIDADGQHKPQDVRRFIATSEAHPAAIISGYPVFDDSVPKVRKYGRRVSTFWVMLETMSVIVKDVLCGYRVYPLTAMEQLIDHYHIGARMDFDTDVLVKAVWDDIPVSFIDTPVRYRDGGTSHFHYLRDNLRLITLHSRLLLQSPLRVAIRLFRHLFTKRGVLVKQ